MNRLDYQVGRLTEATARGTSRREFLKLLMASACSGFLAVLGLDMVSAATDELLDGPCTCAVPCNSLPCCKQIAYHWNDHECSSGQYENCPNSGCGANKCCKHTCKRTCYPNQCICGPWTVTKECVFCPCPTSQCFACTQCPQLPSG